MATQSMTGFGKAEASGDNFVLTVEIKSVNQRFRDIRFKMGSLFSSTELQLKKLVEAKFKRGSFDTYVNYKSKSTKLDKLADLDFDKINAYLELMKEKLTTDFSYQIKPTDFLRSEFFQDNNEEKFEELEGLLLEAFSKALCELESYRLNEGSKLQDVLEKHMLDFKKEFEIVMIEKDSYQQKVEAKLCEKIDELRQKYSIDEARFNQEVVYYLEKLDISEEINRIHIHLDKMKSLLASKDEIGRQLEFLLQEFNRETNTIGSKSFSEKISSAVIQMKVHLEKMREQALNVE